MVGFVFIACNILKESSTETALSQNSQEKFQVTKILCLKKPIASLNLDLEKDGSRKIKDYLNENDLVAIDENLSPNLVWKKAFYLQRLKSRLAIGLIEHKEQNFIECPDEISYLKIALYMDIKAENGEFQRHAPYNINSSLIGANCEQIIKAEISHNSESNNVGPGNFTLFSPDELAANLDSFFKWYCLESQGQHSEMPKLQKRALDAINTFYNFKRLFLEIQNKLPTKFQSNVFKTLPFDFVTMLSIIFSSELNIVMEYVGDDDPNFGKYQELIYETFIRNLGKVCRNNQSSEKSCSPIELINFLQSKQGWYDIAHNPKRYLPQLMRSIKIRPLLERFLVEKGWFEQGAAADRPYEWGNYSCTSEESNNKGFRVLEKTSETRPITLCGPKQIPFLLYKCRPGMKLNQFFVILTKEQSDCNLLGLTNASPSGSEEICSCRTEYKFFGELI